MDKNIREELLDYLFEYISKNKQDKIVNISKYRTRYLTIALEDISDTKDASAVLRSCECFGVQDIHIIDNYNKYKINAGVTMGSSKWLDLYHYNKENEDNTLNCINTIKSNGYKIVSIVNDINSKTIHDLDINNNFALFLSSDEKELSETVRKNSDEIVHIPANGISESYNLSIKSAIVIHYFINKIKSTSLSWKLNNNDLLELRINWVKRILKKAEAYEQIFYSKI